jgi:hypothetical protein
VVLIKILFLLEHFFLFIDSERELYFLVAKSCTYPYQFLVLPDRNSL